MSRRHSDLGFSITKTSERSSPITSVATSGLPVRDTTVRTSGNRSSTFSISVVARSDSVSDTLGSREALITMSPSSSRGMNSPARRAAAPSDTARASPATAEVVPGRLIARGSTAR
jgi:hypothetical protein